MDIPLSLDKIEQARMKILGNARELVEEAELLLSHSRFSRAYFLAHLAGEELAKLPMLVRAAVENLVGLTVDQKKLGRRWSNHTSKMQGILINDYFLNPDMENNADIERLRSELERVSSFNDLKNHSMYVSVLDERFYQPSEIISAELATGMVQLARRRLAFFEEVEEATRAQLKRRAELPDFKASVMSFLEQLDQTPRSDLVLPSKLKEFKTSGAP